MTYDIKLAVETFQEAAHHNLNNPLLTGSILHFPNYGQLVMTGDLHGHDRNFEKIRLFSRLETSPIRHVVLHELIHKEVSGYDQQDTSHEVMLKAARWKCDFPEQIHFLQSNHELAQINKQEITKMGRIVTAEFERSVRQAYGSPCDELLQAMDDFMASFALGARTSNRVWLSHSIPSPREFHAFEPDIFHTPLVDVELDGHGSVYRLVWGRFHTEESISSFLRDVDADFIICGHEPQDDGYLVVHNRMLIIASDHNHGVLLPIDLSKPATITLLEQSLRPLAGIM